MERRAINPWTWQDEFDFTWGIEVTGAQKMFFCAGCVSIDADGNPLHAGDMEAQFNRALDNLERVLSQASLTLGNLVRLTYYVPDIPAFLEAVPKVGVRLKAAGCKPASTLLGISQLAMPGLMIEIEGTAAI